MPATKSLRDRLKDVKSELDTKREERKDHAKARDEAKEKFASAEVPIAEMTESEDFKAAEQAVKALGECDDEIVQLQAAEAGILRMLGESQAPSNGSPEQQQGVGGFNAADLIAGESFPELKRSGLIDSKSPIGTRTLGQLMDRETAAKVFGSGGMFAAEVTSDNLVGAQASDRRGIIPPNLKRLSLLDLIPSGTTDARLVEYVQVLTIPSSAAEVAEGDVKPPQHFTTRDADAAVKTIAGWLKIRRQALDDTAGLQTLLGQLLPYDVRRRIEAQIIAGSGSGENIRGILNTPDIGAPVFVSGDNVADALLRAVTVVVLSDADPNFVALHPLTWQDLLLMREDSGAGPRTGGYLYGSPSSPASPTIWGLQITTNRVVPADEPLVGDSMAATVLYREGVTTRVSDSDQDDFLRNRVTILAEARVAFPVWKPTSFAVAALSAS